MFCILYASRHIRLPTFATVLPPFSSPRCSIFTNCPSTGAPVFLKSDPDVSLQSLRWGQRPVLRLGPALKEVHHPGGKRPNEPVGAEYHQMPGTGNILASDRAYLTLSHLIEATHTHRLNQSPLAA